MKKSSTLSSLSEKGRRIRDALACGQIIIDALKLAAVLLRKEPDLYANMQENNGLTVEPPEGSDEEKSERILKAVKMKKKS